MYRVCLKILFILYNRYLFNINVIISVLELGGGDGKLRYVSFFTNNEIFNKKKHVYICDISFSGI